MKNETFAVKVKAVSWEAQGILSYELRPFAGRELPPFTAGAHVDLLLPSGLTRSYSLVNPQEERHRYVIAVNRDPASRGGSPAASASRRYGAWSSAWNRLGAPGSCTTAAGPANRRRSSSR